jgi:hypothetical protein
MTITVNGTPIKLEIDGSSLGEVLAQVDDLVEKAGSVILGLSLDGKPVDPDTLPLLRDKSASCYGCLDIDSVPASELRSRAYGTLLDFLALLKDWSVGSDSPISIRERWTSYGDTYSGLLSSDEHSFLDLMGHDIDTLPASPLPPDRQRLARHVERLVPIFRERLEELIDPAAAMRSTSLLYAAEKDNLREVPVRLQTGKDAEAMRSILLFVEIFNKANRILPELSRTGTDTEGLRIDGKPLSEFYESFNTILRQLMEAFETKDAVLIGDLAEYEIVPRMDSFFDAIVGALDT